MSSTVQSKLPAEPQMSFFRKTKENLTHIWYVVSEKVTFPIDAITFVFFRALSFVAPSFSYQCEAAWGYVRTLYLKRKSIWLQKEIANLSNENQKLEARIQQLTFQLHQSKQELMQSTEHTEQFSNEACRLKTQRDQFFITRAALEEENKKLKEEVQQLKQKTEILESEKQSELKEKAELQAQWAAASGELDALKISISTVEDYRLLNEQLTQFHDLYLSLPKTQSGKEGITQMALDQLIPCYQNHRKNLHETLQKAIDKLPPNSLEQASLTALLRLSQEEIYHLETISQTLLLIEGLRSTFSTYFQKEIRGNSL